MDEAVRAELQQVWRGYVIHHSTDVARLHDQDVLYTHAMGGLFPSRLDVSTVTDVLDLGCGPGGWVCNVAQAAHVCMIFPLHDAVV